MRVDGKSEDEGWRKTENEHKQQVSGGREIQEERWVGLTADMHGADVTSMQQGLCGMCTIMHTMCDGMSTHSVQHHHKDSDRSPPQTDA